MKKFLAIILCAAMLLPLAGIASAEGTKGVINLYSFTVEIPEMVDRFLADNPDFPYSVSSTVIATTDGLYQPALDQALVGGGSDAPDFYGLESAFVLKYTQGDMAEFAAAYADIGIDISKVESSEIAPYSVDIGTRPSDGALVALGYQATGGALIYRRSIAIDVWGTDDPAVVAEKVGPGLDKFLAAAEELKAKGYSAISSDGDLWHAIEAGAENGWLDEDGALYIDPVRESFIDAAKIIKDNGYGNDTGAWGEAWYADFAGLGTKQVFAFFGPAWLINYVMAGNVGDKFGDYAVAESPIPFFWGGTWVAANKDLAKDPEKAAAVAQIIEWITLDDSDAGLQYLWANGLMNADGTKDTVASGTVMAKSNGSVPMLGDQNMFEVFVPANAYADGSTLTQYDERINSIWQDHVHQYINGNMTREQAIAGFKQAVSDEFGIDAP
jgi:hypothetical protein